MSRLRGFLSGLLSCLLLGTLLTSLGCAHGLSSRQSPEQEAMRADNLYAAGMQQLAAGDLTRAEQYLASALRAGHDPALTIRGLMATCIAAGRLRSALGYAEPYLADHPEQLTLRMLVASLHYALGGYMRSERELSSVLHSSEATPEAHYMMALLLIKQGGEPSAVRGHFRRYLELAPAGQHASEARAALDESAPSRKTVRPRRS